MFTSSAVPPFSFQASLLSFYFLHYFSQNAEITVLHTVLTVNLYIVLTWIYAITYLQPFLFLMVQFPGLYGASLWRCGAWILVIIGDSDPSSSSWLSFWSLGFFRRERKHCKSDRWHLVLCFDTADFGVLCVLVCTVFFCLFSMVVQIVGLVHSISITTRHSSW